LSTTVNPSASFDGLTGFLGGYFFTISSNFSCSSVLQRARSPASRPRASGGRVH
jgi:hypothetical protein